MPLLLPEQAEPSTPAAGKMIAYIDQTGTPRLRLKDDAGVVVTQVDDKSRIWNSSVANQTGFAADTYLIGSSIAIPAGRLPVAKALYTLRFDMVKTAAGTATPILIIRFGTAGTVADTARLTFTFAVGTAAIDTAFVQVFAGFRTVGSGTSAVLNGVATVSHALAATGFTTTGTGGDAIIPLTSSGFDSTVANSIIGASFNGGGSFAGTNLVCQSEWQNP
jgi:hypothetical protein